MSSINLKKNILTSGSFRIVIMVVSFLSGWISARYLGVELKGKYSYLMTMSVFIWMVLDMGLFRSYPYLVRKNLNYLDTLFSWSTLKFLAESLLLIGLGLLFRQFWGSVLGYSFSPVYIFLFVGLITLSQYAMQLNFLLLGLDKVLQVSVTQLINAVILFIIILGCFFMVRTGDRLAYVLIALTIASFYTLLGYLRQFDFSLIRGRINFHYLYDTYKYGFRVFLSSLFIMLLIRFDVILIKRFLGYSQVGIYSIAAHIIDMLQLASNLVGSLLLVRLSDSSDDEEKWLIMKKLLLAFFVFLSLANLGFIVAGKWLLAVLYGNQFVPVYSAYLYLMPASYGLSYGSLFNTYLYSKGFPIISIILPAIALLVNIGLNLVLIPRWGIYGAGIATSFAYILWFVLIIGIEQKQSGSRMFKSLIPHQADWLQLWQEGTALIQDFYQRLSSWQVKR